MPNLEHLSVLKDGVKAWNSWRADNPELIPDLSGASLQGAMLQEANLQKVNLKGAALEEADLQRADLSLAELQWTHIAGTNFSGANLSQARLMQADGFGIKPLFIGATLRGALINDARVPYGDFTGRVDLSDSYLWGSDFREADFREANFTGADLRNTLLARSNFEGATLVGCKVFGVSAWEIRLDRAIQRDLILTPSDVPGVTVDNLEVAQFMNLLLNNQKVRDVIDTITSKVVLILGRFTKERKIVLDALRQELRRHNLTPILFDFDIPADRDITETVTLLARMARFIVADLTDPASIPMELQAIAPDVAVPIRSLVQNGQEPFSMFKTLKKYHWVLPPYEYSDMDELLANLQDEIIAPAEAKRIELKAEQPKP